MDAQNRRNRVLIEEAVESEVPEVARKVMELGPKFIPGRRVTKSTVQQAEVGVERLAFGLRWKEEAEKNRTQAASHQTDTGRPVRHLDNDTRLRKIATTTKQAPSMDDEKENGLRRLKGNIMRLYKREADINTSNNGRQLTRREKEALSTLRRNEGIVVKPSDKSKGFVVMSRDSYVQKANVILECRDSYERCDVKVEDLGKHTRKKVAEITQHKLPQPLAKAILPHNSRPSQFYGLPKDHKPGLPLRPVVSTCGSSMDNVSLLLERILNQLLKFVPAHLTSTKECIDVLSDVGVLPDDCIIASLDVVSLYSNIPVVESIDVVMEFLELHRKEVDMFHLSLSGVRELLSVVLSSNYFQFDGIQYRQRKGLAMGNHLAPPMAIIFMSKLESEAMAMFPWKPRLYRRYIDDCLVVWCHGLVKLMEFVQYLSSRHPDIRFTVEHTQQNVSHTVTIAATLHTYKHFQHYRTTQHIYSAYRL
ncbi:uncharacterized protein LOC135805933 [Sycon ciliatum]|uniref:uncharacterized protein LOC135805933 n=1 Tax=Sycon ciliatum TaxID=27933 RepID=UPI0031F6763A